MTPVFAHITVPVDGSATAQRGVDFALELAAGGGTVTFCSIVDPTVLSIPAAEGAVLDYGPLLTVLDEDAAFFCNQAASLAAAAGIVALTCVVHGERVPALLSACRASDSDAIVIGTHGRTGVERALLGSMAEGLVRGSDVPVVVTHEDDESRTGPVLVAIDRSPAAQAALEEAVLIACARGDAVLLVHVSEDANPPGDAAYATLERAADYARAHGLSVSLVERRGNPAEQIVRAADEAESCMIVMGTHGRTLIPGLLLGSVAAAVVERARIPVATIRRSGRAHREPRVSAPPRSETVA